MMRKPYAHVSQLLLLTGWIAFLAALLIHHEFRLSNIIRSVDIYPATIFTALVLWMPNRWLCAIAAIMIALPALAYVEWAALTEPGGSKRFVNHWFLLLAGVLAISGGISGVARRASGERHRNDHVPARANEALHLTRRFARRR